MNPISPHIKTGTVGELLVQLRLLQFDVQAAPPLKDSGNDLIAVSGDCFRAVQVKTTTGKVFDRSNLPDHYHILAVVSLAGENQNIWLDDSKVFLIEKERVDKVGTKIDRLAEFELSASRIKSLFTDHDES